MENTELGIIDLKGPLPIPYMFDAKFEPPVQLQAKRLYHVGLNNHMGRLRYAYYKRRGWIKSEYYIRPQQSALLEWLHCLVSPAHARATWLRITPEAEEKALLTLKRVVIGLFVAVAFTAGMIVGELRVVHLIQKQQQQIQLQVLSA